jgi:hypothetical protein
MAGSWLSRAAALRTQKLKQIGPGDRQLRRSLTGGFGSASADLPSDLTAAKLTSNLGDQEADVRGRQGPTLKSHSPTQTGRRRSVVRQ